MPSCNLSGNWTSTLIHHQKLYNETIRIRQNGDNILASIKFPYFKKIYEYEFDGKMNGTVINGVYCSTNYKTESGTISLRSINKNILYGFCTFGYKNSDVIQSPYLLVRNRNIRLGTYNFCKNCIGKKRNCCCHPKIDMPIILPDEVKNIKKKFNLKTKDFAELVNLVYRMKRDPKSHACVFYQNNHCQIYSQRPLDCRLFPYGYKIDKNKNIVLINYSKSICKKHTLNKTVIDQSYTIRPLLKFFWPYLYQSSDKKFSQKLDKNKHQVLYKIKNIF